MLLLVGGVRLAGAHAELLAAAPAAGQSFGWARPSEVRLRFSQELVAEETTISVVGVSRNEFEALAVGPTQLDPENPRVAFVALPSLATGTYSVVWHTQSVDGHPLDGSYEFTLQPREPIVTRVVAVAVLAAMGVFVYTRRAGPNDK